MGVPAMSAPRPLILCASVHHGNTARIADVMAAGLGGRWAAPEDVPYDRLEAALVVGFGSGVFYGRMHDSLFVWLRGLPDHPEPTMPAFLFSTAGLPWLSWLWHRSLRRLAVQKGFLLLGEFSCAGRDTWWPLWLVGGLNRRHPDGRDLARAGWFAAGIARQLHHAERPAICA